MRLRCVWLLFTPLLFASAVASAGIDVARSTVALSVDGAAIKADLFAPRGAAASGTVLVLHGAGGMLLDGPEMRRVARHLAADGNAVYVLHYFERTGTLFARDATMQRNFGVWLATVRDAVPAIQAAQHSTAPIGIYGYSLGAFLALQAASSNARVGAVVEQAGGVWNNHFESLGRLPAVLMLHGRRDARVPFAKYVEPLLPIIRKRAASLETHFFPAEGHGFTPPAMAQVREEAARFFRRRLRPDER